MKKENNFNYRKLTLAVIIIGILLRFSLASIYHVSGDACWQLSASRFIAENNKLPLFEEFGRNEPFWAPPLFHFMAAFVYTIFGYFGNNAAEFAVKMISPLLGALTLIFAYLINKKLFNEKITFYSMLFTTFIPMMIDYHVFSYIDGPVTFFVALSVYFALDGKYIKSSVAAGLAAVTKYNGIFILPLLIYIAYKNTENKKDLYKKILAIILIPIIIATPWFIRNYINLGNPFWPFLSFAFKGIETSAFESAEVGSFSLANIFSPKTITFTYLAIFGVPDGNYKNIFFFDFPYIKIFFAIWILGTLFFVIPFAKSFSIKDKAKKRILLIWIALFLIVLLLYIGNASWTAGRFFMPAIPALGMLYGIGLSNLNFKNKKIKNLFFIFLFVAIIGLVAAESAKIVLASRAWNFYKDDFKWVKRNTDKDDLIIPGWQCLAYNINRATLKPTLENLKKADYVWANQNFNLETRSIVTDEILAEVKDKNYKKVYENKKTGTIIYRVTQ